MDELVADLSEGEASDDGLKIVVDSPKRKTSKKPRAAFNMESADKQIIEGIEQQLEDSLEKKALQSNLTAQNVKSLLREVVTNEHVLALVRQTESAEPPAEPSFQPKLTRAKAKELLTSKSMPVLPWPLKSSSEVQQLINDDLDEDSSGDEYVPVEEESEDDRDSCSTSEPDLQLTSPAVTPTHVPESPGEVQWTDDGVFKIPPAKPKDKEEEEANIALRTRSKLCLSSTPLEVIEEAFIPPDITTDMYDMDCDDDDWRDFLKKFTRPLDEITKATEDEDHDPEYNILADEEIDEVDTEELRADKAVKITKKELNELIAELFECENAFLCEMGNNSKSDSSTVETQVSITEGEQLQNTSESASDNTTLNESASANKSADESTSNDLFTWEQKQLLEQQMRQHMQLLTQHFLLTYQHPEFHDSSNIFKEHLVSMKYLTNEKDYTYFKACNLEGALKLVESWEQLVQQNTDEVKAMMLHVSQVISESIQQKAVGITYIPTFPKLILETISKSDVFIYPNLLPLIPFKSPRLFSKNTTFYLRSEDELIALGLEQFVPYLSQDPYNLTCHGQVKLKNLAHMIVQYMMPVRDVTKLYCHIFNSKQPRAETNPIKYYFQMKKAPVTVHYVRDLKEFGIVPPCKRSKELLPYQWRQYVYPDENENASASKQPVPTSITKVPKPPVYNKSFAKSSPRKILAKPTVAASLRIPNSRSSHRPNRGFCSSTPKHGSNHANLKKLEHYFHSPKLPSMQDKTESCIRCFKFNSSIFQKLRAKECVDSSSNMPAIGALFARSISEPDISEIDLTDTSCTVEAADSTIVERDNQQNTPEKSRKESSAIEGGAKNFSSIIAQCNEDFNPIDLKKITDILNNFGRSIMQISELFKHVEAAFAPHRRDAFGKFLTSVTPNQAKSMGKLASLPLFLLKLGAAFKEQPAKLHKIHRSLANMFACIQRSKEVVLPLLKGKSLLEDWFRQIFPCELPSARVLSGDCECANDAKTEVACICNCHQRENLEFKFHSSSCSPCYDTQSKISALQLQKTQVCHESACSSLSSSFNSTQSTPTKTPPKQEKPPRRECKQTKAKRNQKCKKVLKSTQQKRMRRSSALSAVTADQLDGAAPDNPDKLSLAAPLSNQSESNSLEGSWKCAAFQPQQMQVYHESACSSLSSSPNSNQTTPMEEAPPKQENLPMQGCKETKAKHSQKCKKVLKSRRSSPPSAIVADQLEGAAPDYPDKFLSLTPLSNQSESNSLEKSRRFNAPSAIVTDQLDSAAPDNPGNPDKLPSSTPLNNQNKSNSLEGSWTHATFQLQQTQVCHESACSSLSSSPNSNQTTPMEEAPPKQENLPMQGCKETKAKHSQKCKKVLKSRQKKMRRSSPPSAIVADQLEGAAPDYPDKLLSLTPLSNQSESNSLRKSRRFNAPSAIVTDQLDSAAPDNPSNPDKLPSSTPLNNQNKNNSLEGSWTHATVQLQQTQVCHESACSSLSSSPNSNQTTSMEEAPPKQENLPKQGCKEIKAKRSQKRKKVLKSTQKKKKMRCFSSPSAIVADQLEGTILDNPDKLPSPAPLSNQSESNSLEGSRRFSASSAIVADQLDNATSNNPDELSCPTPLNNQSEGNFLESSWTRAEDRIILQMLQKGGDSEETYESIAKALSNRSAPQIKARFHSLMNILQEMSAART